MPPSGHEVTLWTVPPESPLLPQVILVLTQDSCSAPGLHDMEPRLGIGGKGKPHFEQFFSAATRHICPKRS